MDYLAGQAKAIIDQMNKPHPIGSQRVSALLHFLFSRKDEDPFWEAYDRVDAMYSFPFQVEIARLTTRGLPRIVPPHYRVGQRRSLDGRTPEDNYSSQV